MAGKSPLGSDPFARTAAKPKAAVKAKAKAAPKAKPAARPKAKSTTTTRAKAAAKTPQNESARLRGELQAALQQEPVRQKAPDPAEMRRMLSQVYDQLGTLRQTVEAIPVPDAETAAAQPELTGLLSQFRQWFDPKRYLDFWYEFVLASRSQEIDAFGLDPIFEARVETLLSFLYRRWWRVDTVGIENLPDTGRTLIVSNHSGALPYDGAMIKMAARLDHPAARRVRFLVENFVFYFPFLGTFMYRFGSVRASQGNARMLLNRDEVVAVFPEGVKGLGKSYSDRYNLQRFGRGGFVRLAADTQSPIVPVAVIGAEEIHPMIGRSRVLARVLNVPYVPITPTFPLLGVLGAIPYPTKWTIRFGDPFMLPPMPALDKQDMWMHDQSIQVRKRIQELIYLQLQQRQSIFFG